MALIAATNKPVLQQDLINNAKFGYSDKFFDFAVGKRTGVNNTRADLWEGPTATYVFPATAQQMSVVSSSANDADAGTGTQQVHIHYLDANYNIGFEIVTLNGVTPVNTVATNILRINGMHSVRVGSGGSPAGNISLTNVGGTITYGYISAGFNRARQAFYTIPAGYKGYLSHWQASSGTTTGTHFTQTTIRATTHAGVIFPGVFLEIDEVGTLNSGIEISLPIPIQLPAKCDVKLSAISDASNANAVALGAAMGWIEAI